MMAESLYPEFRKLNPKVTGGLKGDISRPYSKIQNSLSASIIK